MKLIKSYETETYVSDNGYYCISQENFPDEEVVIVMLTAPQMRLLIQDMQKQLEDSVLLADHVKE